MKQKPYNLFLVSRVMKKEDERKAKETNKNSFFNYPSRMQLTFGQKAADALTKYAGSWGFIIGFMLFLIVWIIINTVWLIERNWDPYPFILLNLILSTLAAVQAPIILMSQNRQAQKDRLRTEYDYTVDKRAEKEIKEILKQLNRIEKKLN